MVLNKCSYVIVNPMFNVVVCKICLVNIMINQDFDSIIIDSVDHISSINSKKDFDFIKMTIICYTYSYVGYTFVNCNY